VKRLVKKLLSARGDQRPAELLQVRLRLEHHWATLSAHPACKQAFFRTGQVLPAIEDRCQVCGEPLSTPRLQPLDRRPKMAWEEETSSAW